MPRAIIVSSTDHYAHRLSVVESVLQARSYETLILTTDFTHFGKKYYKLSRMGSEQVHTLSYKKNLSVRRLLSHAVFAKRALARVAQEAPDLLYVLVPPNSLACAAARYKKRANVKLVFDLYDMWPEAFPYRKTAPLRIAFRAWSHLRNASLHAADLVVEECALYGEYVMRAMRGKAPRPVPLALRDTGLAPDCVWDDETVHLLYLGSINNIIDIAGTCRVLEEIKRVKPVCLHCIGTGEREHEFYSAAREAGARVLVHGEVYDELEKLAVMNVCRFGLNLLRDGVCVGLTMKSVDYLRGGLPLINNVRGDTALLIAKDAIGLDAEAAARAALMTREENLAFRARARACYEQRFTVRAASQALNDALDTIKA